MRSRHSPLALIAVFPVFALNLIPTCGGGGGGGSNATQLESEPNDELTLADRITLGRPIQGDVSLVGDQDWFFVRLATGRTIQVELFGTRLDQATWDAAGTLPRLTMYFPDANSKFLEHSFSSGWTFGTQDFDIPAYRITQSGAYWIVVRADDDLAAGGRYALRIRYVNPVANQFEIEPPGQQGVDDTPGTAQTIAPGTIAGFHHDANDDYYALPVTGPRVVRVEIVAQRDGAVAGAPTLYDPVLRLYDVDGATLLRENDDAFFHDSAIQYEVQGAGTYFIQVTQSPTSTFNSPYLLLVSADPTTAVAEVEPNNTPIGADPIAYGQAVSGSISPGTEDWFQFAGTAGDMVRLQVFDKNTSQSAAEAVVVTLVAPDGTTPLSTHEGPVFQVLTTILQQSGTFYVRTQPDPAAVGSTTYRLELKRFHAAPYEIEPNDTIAQADPFPPGGFAAGVIATAGDRDLFRFTVSTGELVTFDVFADATATGSNGFAEFSGHGSDLDPLLTIRDTTGAAVATSTSEPAGGTFTESIADGLPTAAVTFVGTPTSHVFYLDVTAADGTGGPNHYYVVQRRK